MRISSSSANCNNCSSTHAADSLTSNFTSSSSSSLSLNAPFRSPEVVLRPPTQPGFAFGTSHNNATHGLATDALFPHKSPFGRPFSICQPHDSLWSPTPFVPRNPFIFSPSSHSSVFDSVSRDPFALTSPSNHPSLRGSVPSNPFVALPSNPSSAFCGSPSTLVSTTTNTPAASETAKLTTTKCADIQRPVVPSAAFDYSTTLLHCFSNFPSSKTSSATNSPTFATIKAGSLETRNDAAPSVSNTLTSPDDQQTWKPTTQVFPGMFGKSQVEHGQVDSKLQANLSSAFPGLVFAPSQVGFQVLSNPPQPPSPFHFGHGGFPGFPSFTKSPQPCFQGSAFAKSGEDKLNPAKQVCPSCGHTTLSGQLEVGGTRLAPSNPSLNDTEQIHSISAMPIYKDKSHEEVRWEEYQLQGVTREQVDPLSKSSTSAQPQFVLLPVMPLNSIAGGFGAYPCSPTLSAPFGTATVYALSPVVLFNGLACGPNFGSIFCAQTLGHNSASGAFPSDHACGSPAGFGVQHNSGTIASFGGGSSSSGKA